MERLGSLRYYVGSLIFTVVVLAVMGAWKGGEAFAIVAMLGILEVSLSFDNAVVNAIKLKLLNGFWQQMFIYLGIFIAVGVVRFLLPIVVVMMTAGLGFGTVVSLALHHPDQYSAHLQDAHVTIAVVGGVFLLMIFLNNFIAENDERVYWIGPLERPLANLSNHEQWLQRTIAVLAIAILWLTQNMNYAVIVAGLGSLAVYEIVGYFGDKFEDEDGETADEEMAAEAKGKSPVKAAGWASFAVFLYLEVQDAMFSFDGVSGAFAISKDVFIIMAGLAIGAMFIRSMTVHFVRTDKLGEFRYLGNGAMWAIGFLAVVILISTAVDIPNWVTGMIGVCFIASAWTHSIIENRRDAKAEESKSAPLAQPLNV